MRNYPERFGANAFEILGFLAAGALFVTAVSAIYFFAVATIASRAGGALAVNPLVLMS